VKRPVLVTLFFLVFITGKPQTILDSLVVDARQGELLIDFLGKLEQKHPVRFFFMDEWLSSYSVDSVHFGQTVHHMLQDMLRGSEIEVSVMYGYAVVFVKDPLGMETREELLRTAVASKKDIESRTIGTAVRGKRKDRVWLRGIVRAEDSGLPMSGVAISANGKEVTTTDASGRYAITLAGNEHVIIYSFFGCSDKVIDLKIYSDGELSVVLEEVPVVLEEVEVSEQAVVNRRISQTTLKAESMKRATTFLGEVDIIKQIQSQPGVTTVGEVASGFNVRGGGVDQNLVLYDGVPIFNTSHALGFFTAFNAHAINQVSFYRGGIPAQYGGRVSSVLDISSKDGPGDKWGASGGIGIISSYLTVGGPIRPDTTAVIASVRGSYSDWMLDAVKSNYQDVQNSAMSFYDASLKITHKASSKSKLTFSGYTSSDQFSLTNDTIYAMRNVAASLRLDRSISDKLFGSIALSFGRYDYTMREKEPATAFDLKYSITYPSLNLDFNYEGTQHKLSFGLHNTWYDFAPGSLTPTAAESNARGISMPHERSLETAFYLGDAIYWRDNILVEGGLRVSMYNRFGSGTTYSYTQDEPLETRNITGSKTYGSGEVMKTYAGLEPRLSLRYTLNAAASVKLGYNRMYQYMHLITNTAAVAPVDIWQSSNTYFKPQIADQISIGYFRNFNDNTFEAFVEPFYKHVQHVLDFKDGANLILNDHLETALVGGTADAYGAEFSISKIKGRLQGALNYTYSRSWRKTNTRFDTEDINEGKRYPSNYDQPHVVQFNWRYGILRRLFFSGTFIYHTGRPMSIPVSAFKVDNISMLKFSDRNTYRIPDYHRLDLALILEGSHRRKKILDGTWVLSFYNVYSRRNAYSVFYEENGRGNLVPYKLSVIGTVIPSLSYSFKF
jgi:hypothetical protein